MSQRVLYFDCFSGISGDMVLGALLDAGLPLDALTNALGSLAVSGFDIGATRVLRAGVSATKFSVHEHGAQYLAPRTQHRTQHPAPRTPHRAQHPSPGTRHGHDHHDFTGAEAPPVARTDADASPQSRLSSARHSRRRPHSHDHEHPHRTVPEIFALIDRSRLSAPGRDRAKALFQRLADAEAAVHQTPVDKVHLHEVGALDSIIDIVGAVFALEWFGAGRIVSSPLNVGGGMVDSAHGRFPVPAPATVKLLGDAPIYGGTVQEELVTPTGALIVSSYASQFGPIPAMTVDKVGYGAGEREFASTPNVLRVLVGRASRDDARPPGERVTVIECEIDDMNPQLFGVAMDRLYAAGALEVFLVPVQMKKNRPGTLLTVVTAPERRAMLADIIFRETTTIGLRHYDMDRECLERELVTVQTPVGAVRVKIARRDGRVVNAVPEFEDCARLASTNNLSVKEVQAMAVKAYGGFQSLQS